MIAGGPGCVEASVVTWKHCCFVRPRVFGATWTALSAGGRWRAGSSNNTPDHSSRAGCNGSLSN